MQQSVLAFLFAVCLIQGAFLGPLVARLDGGNRRASLVLSALLLCFLPMIGEELVEAAGLTARLPHVIGSSIAVDFLIAPLLLFYAWTLTDRNRSYTRRDLVHFVPFGLAVLILLPFYFQSGPAKLRVVESGLPATMTVVIVAKILVGTAYLTAVVRRLVRFLNRPGESGPRDPHLVWFLRTMVVLACVVAISVVIALLPSAGDVPIDSDVIGTLVMCGSIYVISYLLIRHPFAQPVLAGESRVATAPRAKYETSPLDEVTKRHYLDRLNRHMETEKPFLDMQLSLEKLSSALDVRPTHLSQVLNETMGVNFYEFVNGWRVREVQVRIADPAQSSRTLLALAHESGFNSKASFNRAFKRVTGVTPTEYARGLSDRRSSQS